MTKSELVWLQNRFWCRDNPDKKAIIFTPDGIFTLTFTPHPTELLGVDASSIPNKSDA